MCAPITQDQFLARSAKIHGSRYDYSKSVCLSSKTPVTIICPVHGEFQQKPQKHWIGHGCPKCTGDKISRSLIKRFENPEFRKICGSKLRHTTEKFIARAKAMHGDTYDYSEVVYANALTDVKIGCHKHGVFMQTPSSHVNGHGCIKCSNEKFGASRSVPYADYIKRANEIHKGKYSYPEIPSDFTGNGYILTITCKKHGDFEQRLENHIYRSAGCPRCGFTISKGEDDLCAWIKSLGIDVVPRDRKIIKPYELDIVVPSKRIAIEFNGVKWHSIDPLDAGNKEETSYHHTKWKMCLDAGYQLLTVWDYDWKEHRSLIEHWLRHKLGVSTRKCSARQCNVSLATTRVANSFYSKFHLQGPPANGTHCALYIGEEMVACMTFSKSSSDRKHKMEEGEFTLSRFALSGSVPGAATKLFKHLVDKTKAVIVTTYSDNSYTGGGVYPLLGFSMHSACDPDFKVWHYDYGVRHKSFWQRCRIPARIKELGSKEHFDPNTDTRTALEMKKLLGCRLIWDCGKIRWEWRAPSSQVL